MLNRLESGVPRWLLVFDNAGAPEEVRSLLPAAGDHVTVTTRDGSWRHVGRAVEVTVFTRGESIQLLQSHGHDISFDDADQLAELLGDLPLALEQVATMQVVTVQAATRMSAEE